MSFNHWKRFVLTIVFIAFILGSSSCAKGEKKPNILFILSDDQPLSALSYMGSQADTPNLDALINRGVFFKKAYYAGAHAIAVCATSRTMFHSGKQLLKAAEIDITGKSDIDNAWSRRFSRGGYKTYFSGKWHVGVFKPEQVFDQVVNVRGGMPSYKQIGFKKGYGYNRPMQDIQDEWQAWNTNLGGHWEGGIHWSEQLAMNAKKFLKQTEKHTEPFFMYLSFSAPHDPRQAPKAYLDKYPLKKVEVPENFFKAYPYVNPRSIRKNSVPIRDERLAPLPRTEYAIKVHRREYYAILDHMDAQIGRILQELKKSEEADNTIIIFTSDNGLALGEHGFLGKQNLHEHSIKMPLIIAGPGIPEGKTIETPVYVQDIVPTALELAGILTNKGIEFKSLVPLIRGTKEKLYSHIYAAYKNFQMMVSDGRYKLIYYEKAKKMLFFDLETDPFETNNLAGKREYFDLQKKLESKLHPWRKKVKTSPYIAVRD